MEADSEVLPEAGGGRVPPAQGSLIRKRFRGPFSAARCGEPPPSLMLAGIEQFNRGEFFEQHETLEELWRAEPDDVRYLYQGILQLGVGFLHLSRGNYHGTISKLTTGLQRLRWFEPVCQGVDVRRLVEEAGRCLEEVERLGPDGLPTLDRALIPRVHLM